MKLLSIEDLKKYELNNVEQMSVMAKGTEHQLKGKLDTDGEEDCYPSAEKVWIINRLCDKPTY